jgi:hypothetical protein
MAPPPAGGKAVPRPIFLLSTGRTGTRFFANLISEYGVGVSAHHITPYTRPLNVLSNLACLGLLPQAVSDGWFRLVKAPGIAATPGRYLECNNYYFASAPAIRRIFPQSRILVLTRHPRDFALSQIRWERQRLSSRIANRLVPFWGPVWYWEQLQGWLGDDRQRVRYYARVWSRRNAALLATTESDGQAMRLRFEDVFADPGGAERLRALLDWLGLGLNRPLAPDALARRLNQTQPDPSICWQKDWDLLLEQECGELMRRLGSGV